METYEIYESVNHLKIDTDINYNTIRKYTVKCYCNFCNKWIDQTFLINNKPTKESLNYNIVNLKNKFCKEHLRSCSKAFSKRPGAMI